MGRITTHLLDLTLGEPASHVEINLYRVKDEKKEQLAKRQTNVDGRLDQPLLEGDNLIKGTYQMEIAIGDYFRQTGRVSDFLEVVPIRFQVNSTTENYHVPLLISPFGYQFYRGS
ncbi:hydroxyisourate hydrolase [Sporolactobacillus spathodeae]|uniref:5-hydroxyisourate hydrolase n=1 Tax=Sporolactobacillus spathodeae TaxID=1465502 RepID=A0ABS2Q8W7_9BACL|nr:hydroxyisourate hydrolase [Sporolactobacillus spathodeae]MBM7658219.1 5-hydroxyisourate hydrolase [Sporolactobacillus spathodeae]